MNFLKTHSFGNDFIILDDPKLIDKKDLGKFARKLCHRHLGIGADGLLVILPTTRADCSMRIINADGSEAKMCGNGIRCLAKYVFESGIVNKKKFNIETAAGIIPIKLTLNEKKILSISVAMGQPLFSPKSIPAKYPGRKIIDYPLDIAGSYYHITSMLLGVPHTVIFVNRLNQDTAAKVGALIEKHALFPQKTNVDFVKVIDQNTIKMLTWERGVGLSLACGTGSCAAVVAARINRKTKSKVAVHFAAGKLFAKWHKNGTVSLTGPAPQTIAKGEILF